MIRYALRCADGHEFEAWFRSSADYDDQAKAGRISCVHCGSTAVTKTLMAPNLGTRQNKKSNATPTRIPPPTGGPQGNMPVGPPVGHPGRALAEAPMRSIATEGSAPPEAVEKLVNLMRAVRSHVIENGTDVGKSFADEARRIHYEEAPERLIYGETTPDDREELAEEGIAIAPLPVLPEDHN